MTDKTKLKMPASTCDAKAKKLVDAYNGLPSLEKAIVHILAVIYCKTARTNIANVLNKLPVGKTGARHTATTLDPICMKLAVLGVIKNTGIHFRCAVFLAEPVCRLLADLGRFDEIAAAVRSVLPVSGNWRFRLFSADYDSMVREVRIALYQRDADHIRDIVSQYENASGWNKPPHPFATIFQNGFDAKWVAENVPHELHADIATALLESRGFHKSADRELFSFLKICAASMEKGGYWDSVRVFLSEQAILQGRLDEAKEAAAGMANDIQTSLVKGVSAFFTGRNEEAISQYEAALALLKKKTRKRKTYFVNLSGIFFILALLKSGTPNHVRNAKIHTGIAANDYGYRFQRVYQVLNLMIEARGGDPDSLDSIRDWRMPSHLDTDSLSIFFQILALFWNNKKEAAKSKKLLKELHAEAEKRGYDWLAAESAALLSRMPGTGKKFAQKAETFFERSGILSIVDLIQPESKWKQALNALVNLGIERSAIAETEKTSRLVWLFGYEDKYRTWELSPREQVKNKKGWSKGRKIAMRRLYREIETLDTLTAQDKSICACLEENRYIWRGYPEITYHFNSNALKALVGHPLVFSARSPNERIEFVDGRPELLVNSRSGGKFEISFTHEFDTRDDIQIIRETPTRFKVIETGDDIIRIAKVIGNGLKVPAAGKTHLLQAVDSVSAVVTVHSQIDGIGKDAEDVPADATPNIHLRPSGSGLRLETLVQPFPEGGPCFRPGEGGETVISEIDGKQLRTKRDHRKEKRLADRAMAACPTPTAIGESRDGMWEWEITDPEDCLETLLELNALNESVILKWPEGEQFKIRRRADLNRFHISVKKRKDWFAVSGELKLDEGLVVSMDQLLSLVEETPGRFVRMEDGQFLALTREFRQRLDELAAYSRKSGKSRRFHPLAAPFLEELAADLGGFASDKHWKAHLKRLNDARSLEPDVPSTFKGDLRDYQTDGFRWLARLSHWGVGACLADDMGLGKTIQALAIILTNAAKGPTLVVAPTSVCMNWETEAERFAPTLNIVTFGNGDREAVLNGLKPLDLLLVTYGLLQQEKVAQLLSRVHFAAIVLDEAQAIKNLATKRSRAAMKLDGDFKLITTGTPVENHLGELWNLFRFVNPGFLGSLEEFNKTFAGPIEKDRDRNATRRLKKLVRPFVLRRTKNQVLEELPQRTDIVLRVELNPEELAFYEALRRKALENLNGGDAPPKNMHLKILAEIMKLRRACCNTKLVLPDASLPSAKLEVFGDIVGELLANGHKALVFSQFTDHLAIIREHVENKSIPYQYLDGSTPKKKRAERVNAFQNGEGELFLISLKAGGLGLNLTAADYVIHMDPWWNPAVEDQASDRAHRIGQKRPVTVYRLVARHTIEEKIVALHKKKRSLADSLLDGADMSGKITADELLRLIREA